MRSEEPNLWEEKLFDVYIIRYAKWMYTNPINIFTTPYRASVIHMLVACIYTGICYMGIHAGYPLAPTLLFVAPIWVLALVHCICANRVRKIYKYQNKFDTPIIE